jgi:hypothetical protein
MSKWILLILACLACTACENKLETGYEPTKLGMSGASRRAMYSDPYTSEAQAAQQDQAAEAKSRRPSAAQY